MRRFSLCLSIVLLAACGGSRPPGADSMLPGEADGATKKVDFVGDAAARAPAAPESMIDGGPWKITRGASAVDGAVALTMQRDATTGAVGSAQPIGPMVLLIRCYSGAPNVRLLAMTGASGEEEVPMKYRFDAGKVQSELWSAFSAGAGGDAPNPRAFLRASLQADTLHIERVTGGGGVEGVIGLAELRQHLADIKAACGVSP